MFIKFVTFFHQEGSLKVPVGKAVPTDWLFGMHLDWGLEGPQCKVTAIMYNCIDHDLKAKY